MALDVSWNNLPSVVLLEIFQRISHKERINASSTCKEWRKALYFPNFWREITIKLFSDVNKTYTIERCHFLTRSFMSSLRNVTIICGYQEQYITEVVKILSKLSCNRQIKRLILFSTGKPIWNDSFKLWNLNILNIIDNAKKLETVCLSHCWLPLSEEKCSLQNALEKHATTLSCLQIGVPAASLTDDVTFMPLVDYSVFRQLTILNLNHSLVTNDVIVQLCDTNQLLKRLIMQVEEMCYSSGIKDEMWEYFRHKMPNCELRINIVQGQNEKVLEVITHGMPVTHLKLLYCSKISLRSMSCFSTLKDLKSICCITDSREQCSIPEPNPFVICAWACEKLEEIVCAGYMMDYEDLIGIARLKEFRMSTLEVPLKDTIKFLQIDGKWRSRNLYPSELKRFKTIMSSALNRTWGPSDAGVWQEPASSTYDQQVNTITKLLSRDLEN